MSDTDQNQCTHPSCLRQYKWQEIEGLASKIVNASMRYGPQSPEAQQLLAQLQAHYDVPKRKVYFWLEDRLGDLCVSSPFDILNFPLSIWPIQMAGYVEQTLDGGRVRILKSRLYQETDAILEKSRRPS